MMPDYPCIISKKPKYDTHPHRAIIMHADNCYGTCEFLTPSHNFHYTSIALPVLVPIFHRFSLYFLSNSVEAHFFCQYLNMSVVVCIIKYCARDVKRKS